MTIPRPRIFLVTPASYDVATFAPILEAALDAGDVASLLITNAGEDEHSFQRTAETLVPIAQHRDVAALIANDTRIAGRAKADGIHIDTGLDELKAMVEKFQPKYIVGAGGLGQRHEAMLAGETGADYVFFGRLDRPENEEAHPQDLELGNWWVELFQPPCVVMAGGTLASVGEVIEAGADFIGLRDAIWTHPEGAAAAIQIANALIDADAETAA